MIRIAELQQEAVSQIPDLIREYRKSEGRQVSAEEEDRIIQQLNKICSLQTGSADRVVGQSRIFTAQDSDRIVGYIGIHYIPFALLAGAEIYVSDLLVSEKFRGAGVGSKLLGAVEDYARDLGCIRLILNNIKTAHSYERGFYKMHGFEERIGVANFVKNLKE